MSVVHKFVPFLEKISNEVAHQPRAAASKTIHAEVRSAKHAAGQKSAVLCISGFACSSYNFAWIADELNNDHTTVLIDNRGMGQSSSADSEYELLDLAEDGARVMETLGFEKFHVIGISMGGMIAQLLAIHYPNRVLSLSLLCSSSGGGDFPKLPEITHNSLEQFYSIPEPKRSEIGLMAYTHSVTREQQPSLFQAMVELRSSSPANFAQVLLQKSAVDRFLMDSSPLDQIQCPTLILAAAEDRFVPLECARVFQRKIKQTELQILKDCDHFFFLERASETSKTLNAFLGKSNSKQKSPIESQTESKTVSREAYENL